MLSIYIADDEPMAIRYLETLLTSCGFPCRVIGTQTNSTKAYFEIRSMKPDIVFTDICMPVMDGLELAKKILASGSTKVFLLTSYEDFEYAKKGVKIGVSDYLLKNELTEQGLKTILEEASRDIRLQRSRRQMLLEHNVRHFLFGTSAVTEDHIYEERALQRYALLVFYRLPRFFMVPDPQTEENISLDTYEIQHMDYPKGMRCAAFAQIRPATFCAVVFISETVVDSSRRLLQMADIILPKIEESGRTWKCIGSDICLHFFELQDQFHELDRRTGYLYTYLDRSVFRLEDVPVPDSGKDTGEEMLIRMERFLTDAKHEEAMETAKAYFYGCRSSDTQSVYMQHMREFYQVLRRCAIRDGRGLEYLSVSPVYSGAADLERALLNCVELYFQEREQAEQMLYSTHVLRAQQFIRKEYTRDISVAEIALSAGISEGHLRRLFKQEMDMSVVDYLTEYRIHQAKLLLRDPSRSTPEIWQETGFSSAQYFSYVFKKREGMTPREYQKGGGEPARESKGKAAVKQ